MGVSWRVELLELRREIAAYGILWGVVGLYATWMIVLLEKLLGADI